MPLGQAGTPINVQVDPSAVAQGLPVRQIRGIGDSAVAAASVAAPGAAGVVVQAAGLVVGGVYTVRGFAVLTGTAETQLANLRLRQNGATIGSVPSVPGPIMPFEVDRVTVGANGIIDLVAVAAATAGSVYTALLVVQRVA